MDRDAAIAAFSASPVAKKGAWKPPNGPIKLGGLSWSPDFTGPQKRIAVLLTGGSIASFLVKRLEAARESGYQITGIVGLDVLSNSHNVRLLSDLDAEIVFTRDHVTFSSRLPLMKALAQNEVAVASDDLQYLVEAGLKRCKDATSASEKGNRLESLLHLMFEAVADFSVVECNYNTASEELDIVVQLRRFDPARSWSHLNCPILMVESKNRQDRQGQEVVTKLFGILTLKGDICRIGFIVSLSGFTSDARNQVLRTSATNKTIVLLDGKDLRDWASATDYDGALEAKVRKAMLN